MSNTKQQIEEMISDFHEDAIRYSKKLYTGHVKTYEEIEKDFEKLLSTVDSIVDLILSDRKAYDEEMLEAKKQGFYMACGLLGKEINECEPLWESCLAALEEHQRNQGETQ